MLPFPVDHTYLVEAEESKSYKYLHRGVIVLKRCNSGKKKEDRTIKKRRKTKFRRGQSKDRCRGPDGP